MRKLAPLLLFLGGCATQAPIYKPVEVPVTKYIRVVIPPQLLQPCVVAEPDAACWDSGQRVFCNGQLADMRLQYRAALQKCNADKAGIAAANK